MTSRNELFQLELWSFFPSSFAFLRSISINSHLIFDAQELTSFSRSQRLMKKQEGEH